MPKYIDFEYEKKIIGLLIGYYRKQSGNQVSTFLINKKDYYRTYCIDCAKCTNNEVICSPKTLYQLEKGKALKNECYYYRLCENLNKKVVFDHDISKKLDRYRETLYQNMVDFSKTNLLSLLNMIENDLSKEKETIYVKERLILYKSIIEYKIFREVPTNESIEIYLLLKNYVDEADNMMILLLMYDLSFKRITKAINRETIILESEKYFDDPIFFRMKLFSNTDITRAYNIFNDYMDNMNSLTAYQRYCLNEYMAFVNINNNLFENGYKYLEECKKIIKQGADLSDHTIMNCRRQSGIICFLLNKFDETIDDFIYLINRNASSIGLNYILLFNALEKTNQSEKILEIVHQMDKTNTKNKEIMLIMIYYKKKYSSDILSKSQMSDLEDFINEELIEVIKIGGEIYENIFREDLRYYISKTTNYKKYFIFDDLLLNNHQFR